MKINTIIGEFFIINLMRLYLREISACHHNNIYYYSYNILVPDMTGTCTYNAHAYANVHIAIIYKY